MLQIQHFVTKINIAGKIYPNEPLARHTTLQVGGPADLYVVPHDADDLLRLLRYAHAEAAPLFILGGGANILVADAGIRGIVVDMRGFDQLERDGDSLVCGAGGQISSAAGFAADNGLSGLHFLYTMPGSVGGALWMNARCYGSSIADIIEHADLLSVERGHYRYSPRPQDFDYKKSPFQGNEAVIVRARFQLVADDPGAIRRRMDDYQRDRTQKGHFDAPSAGSIFKNDRTLGKPTGALLDTLGIRGRRLGGARVSPQHANIIVNDGTATASDLRTLIEAVADEARERLGISLEREVLYVGDWGDWGDGWH